VRGNGRNRVSDKLLLGFYVFVSPPDPIPPIAPLGGRGNGAHEKSNGNKDRAMREPFVRLDVSTRTRNTRGQCVSRSLWDS